MVSRQSNVLWPGCGPNVRGRSLQVTACCRHASCIWHRKPRCYGHAGTSSFYQSVQSAASVGRRRSAADQESLQKACSKVQSSGCAAWGPLITSITLGNGSAATVMFADTILISARSQVLSRSFSKFRKLTSYSQTKRKIRILSPGAMAGTFTIGKCCWPTTCLVSVFVAWLAFCTCSLSTLLCSNAAFD